VGYCVHEAESWAWWERRKNNFSGDAVQIESMSPLKSWANPTLFTNALEKLGLV
jgi:hypothetical protein